MWRFQDVDLLGIAVAELVNFVNSGKCEGAVVSLFWPFHDNRYKRIYLDVSRSLPNVRASGRGWPHRWPATAQSVHRSLRRALREQLVRVAEGQKPLLPTSPGWTPRNFARLSPVEAATVTAMHCAFDDALGVVFEDHIRIRPCKRCGLFYFVGGEPGRPPDFCDKEHRVAYRGTAMFKKSRAADARRRRAIEKEGLARAAQAVGIKPR